MVLHISFVCRAGGSAPWTNQRRGCADIRAGPSPAPATTVRLVNIQMGGEWTRARPARLCCCWRGRERGRGCELGRTLQFEVRPMKFVEYSALAHNTRQSPATGRGCWRLQWTSLHTAASSLRSLGWAVVGMRVCWAMPGYATMPLCITCKIRRRGPPGAAASARLQPPKTHPGQHRLPFCTLCTLPPTICKHEIFT